MTASHPPYANSSARGTRLETQIFASNTYSTNESSVLDYMDKPLEFPICWLSVEKPSLRILDYSNAEKPEDFIHLGMTTPNLSHNAQISDIGHAVDIWEHDNKIKMTRKLDGNGDKFESTSPDGFHSSLSRYVLHNLLKNE
ncbi:uncharacterized protein MELLADRAFT_110245 [Melampsora larici-populina 98AG31]|uniref:Uncharacterized protein n=1 Tax=Melampsora larici-populina (strain 98AG31 / pathotype 3-4-7) TaxID=747676 RepID=F4RZ53_MELLP|nr:uncharacterized protein MELLADRAFT_110245 [Melampsora larici-populina 98AG31]EGG02376.1 hypothetical protein MELLADRAFT_110245 [Melampsora larici-populina 98AG31]